MKRSVFLAAAALIMFSPLFNHLGVPGTDAWKMFAHARPICDYAIYPKDGTPGDRLSFTREDFRAAPIHFVMEAPNQWRAVLTTLCRARPELRSGRYLVDLNCFDKELRNVFTGLDVHCGYYGLAQ